jgi:hypothetical protein
MTGPYIWVISLKDVTDNIGTELDRARNAGQSIWSYHVLNQDNYSPKWFIDYPPIDERVQAGFMNQSLEVTGILAWATDYYSESRNSAVWDSMGSGDGILVYHGARVGVEGVIGGTRLKGFREGIEDFEYVELLKKEGEKDFAMEKIRTVAADQQNWTQDLDELLGVRKELGDRLHALNTPTLKSGIRTPDLQPISVRSSGAGILIRAPRLVAVEIFDLRGKRLSLNEVSLGADGNEMLISGLTPGAFVVRTSAGDRSKTIGLVQF